MEKVKLPKLVAEGISNARELGFTSADIITKSFEVRDQGSYRDAIRDFAADNFDTFLSALVNGYEIEETPEDKVREQYQNPRHFQNNSDTPTDVYKKGIKFALDTLNIKIKGVNDFDF